MKIKKLIGVLVALAVVPVASAFAGTVPATLSGTTVITAPRAKKLIDGGTIKVIDVRVKLEYTEEHLPGAINVTYHEKSSKSVDFDASQDSFDLSKLPSDKNQPMIVYCNGPECWKSFKASKTMVKAGYKNLYWLRGGIPAWKKAGYSTEK